MASLPSRPSAKLFHVLVAGGLAMATPACSSSDPVVNPDPDAGSSKDGSASSHDASTSHDSGGGGVDSGGGNLDASAAADACLNVPGDCTHGLCSW